MWLTLVNTSAFKSKSSSLSGRVIFFELISFCDCFFVSFLMNCRMMGEVMSCIKGQVRVCYMKLVVLIYVFVKTSFNIPAAKLTPI